jgi:hypothetical protein
VVAPRHSSSSTGTPPRARATADDDDHAPRRGARDGLALGVRHAAAPHAGDDDAARPGGDERVDGHPVGPRVGVDDVHARQLAQPREVEHRPARGGVVERDALGSATPSGPRAGATKASGRTVFAFVASRAAKISSFMRTIAPRPRAAGLAATRTALSRFAGPSTPTRPRGASRRSRRRAAGRPR